MKIAILEDYQDAVRQLPCFALLEGHEVDVFTKPMDDDAMAEHLAQHEAVVLIRERTHMTAALMDRLPRLRLISQTGKVSGNVDMAAAQQRDITVLEGVGDPTAPAELSWALLMAAYRRLPQYVSQLQSGHWQRVSGDAVHDTIGRALKGDVLGIWGYGKIGQRMARYARAFDMEILVWGRAPSLELARADGHRVATSKEAFFAEADVVTLHLRLNDATRGIVTAEDLAGMKPTALLLNTSRAELIETGVLKAALQQGRPGFAALDVFEQEPLNANDTWLQMPNVVATPHLGYVEQKGYELYFSAALRNVLDFVAREKAS